MEGREFASAAPQEAGTVPERRAMAVRKDASGASRQRCCFLRARG